MQGRLSPPVPGRLQAFPILTWEDEFQRARILGFDAIELVFEEAHIQQNPLWTREGIAKIRRLSDGSGVRVFSVCLDYLMEHPFVRVSQNDRRQSISVLNKIISQSALSGIERILIPILEFSEIRTKEEKNQVVTSLRECLPVAEAHRVELAVETSLSAEESLQLLEEVGHPFLKIYYDIGNAAALGYDAPLEIRRLGSSIVGIHVKDRKHLGKSVILGTGDADFHSCFKVLHDIGYGGPYILQTAMTENYLGVAKSQLQFVKEQLFSVFQEANCAEKGTDQGFGADPRTRGIGRHSAQKY